jgi:hypothetical protein
LKATVKKYYPLFSSMKGGSMIALGVVLLGILTRFAFTAQTSTSARKGKKSGNAFFSGLETSGEMIDPGSTGYDQGNQTIHGMIQRAQDVTNDERVDGELTIETNAYLDPANHWGQLWGTFILENSGGKWLAAWIGHITAQGVTIYAMGYGIGAYKDLMANWTYTRIGSDSQTPFNIQGLIVRTSQAEASFGKPNRNIQERVNLPNLITK